MSRSEGWRGRDRRLIATWLVLTWNEAKQCYYRSVMTAEAGKEGDIGAVYRVRIEWNVAHSSRIDKRYFLKLHGSTAVMDGTPRSLDADHKAVEDGNVAQYVNSNLNAAGEISCPCNCTREWSREWDSIGSEKVERELRAGAYLAMGLKLKCALKAHTELLYPYHWHKNDKASGRIGQVDAIADLMQYGAPERNQNERSKRIGERR